MSLIKFNFNTSTIRFVDGKPVASDVAKVLGYADPKATISKKVSSKNKGVAKIETPGGNQSITVLEEAGIYQLIFGSKLPNAEQFQDWVFEEVLPSIRKTGSYSTSSLEQLSDGQKIVLFAKALIKKDEENIALQAQIEEQAPLVSFAELIQHSDTCISFNEYAKCINWGRNKLMIYLREIGVLMKNSTLPYQKWCDSGYFEVSQEIIANGKLIPFAVITGKGQLWLTQRIKHYKAIEQKAIQGITQGVIDMSK